ncbi:MAG TPA: hypothetical protein VF509_15035 [Sphingobium sp.]
MMVIHLLSLTIAGTNYTVSPPPIVDFSCKMVSPSGETSKLSGRISGADFIVDAQGLPKLKKTKLGRVALQNPWRVSFTDDSSLQKLRGVDAEVVSGGYNIFATSFLSRVSFRLVLSKENTPGAVIISDKTGADDIITAIGYCDQKFTPQPNAVFNGRVTVKDYP